MIVDDRLILDSYALTDLQNETLTQMQKDYDLQHPDNTTTLKAIKVDGYVCIAEFNDWQEMTSDIVRPLKEDGTRYPIQKVRLEFSWDMA